MSWVERLKEFLNDIIENEDSAPCFCRCKIKKMIKPITVDGRGKQNLIDIPFECVYVCERGKIKILIFAYA